MGCFAHSGAALEWRGGHEKVRIEPWGRSSLRVRGTVWQAIRDDLPGALLEPAPAGGDTDDGTGSDVSAGAARISRIRVDRLAEQVSLPVSRAPTWPPRASATACSTACRPHVRRP